jgi:hypothetical protein
MWPADPDDPFARALAELPALPAPRSLLPRVLAASEELSRRPWYAHTWRSWPLALQVLSLALLLLVAAGSAIVVPVVRLELTGAFWRLAQGRLIEFFQGAQRLDAAMNACVVLWQALIVPLAAYAAVLAALACLMGAAFATVLRRVALSRF